MGDSTRVAFSSQIHGDMEEAYQGCDNELGQKSPCKDMVWAASVSMHRCMGRDAQISGHLP